MTKTRKRLVASLVVNLALWGGAFAAQPTSVRAQDLEEGGGCANTACNGASACQYARNDYCILVEFSTGPACRVYPC